jgi:hypothetical protein
VHIASHIRRSRPIASRQIGSNPESFLSQHSILFYTYIHSARDSPIGIAGWQSLQDASAVRIPGVISLSAFNPFLYIHSLSTWLTYRDSRWQSLQDAGAVRILSHFSVSIQSFSIYINSARGSPIGIEGWQSLQGLWTWILYPRGRSLVIYQSAFNPFLLI